VPGDALLVDEHADVFVGQRTNLRDLVRCAEAIEEMQERKARVERGDMRDKREVLRLLHRA
jgi:hypothetical protein